jgi:Bax protein
MMSFDSNDSKDCASRQRPSYEQFALGFVGLCVVGMYAIVALSPGNRAMHSLPPAPAAVVVKASPEPMEPSEKPSVLEGAVETVKAVVAMPPKPEKAVVGMPPKPERKPDYTPSYAPLTLTSGDDSWQPERLSVSMASPPSGGPVASLHGGVAVKSAAKLGSFFNSLGYSLAKVRYSRQSVPRVFLDRLPRDLKTMSSVSARKTLFLKAMLPLILQVNDTIMADRRKLLVLNFNSQVRVGGALLEKNRVWLEDLAGRYGLDEARLDRATLVKLLDLVDVVPASLALSQAAEESGWGTSRFAQDGNAPFGQWTFDEARGLIPADRDAGSTHAVRVYSRLIDGVQAYVDNLNTHRAYGDFRKARAAMHRLGADLDGFSLAKTLTRYSKRGHDYVDTLHTIISINDLAPLDRAQLHGAQMAGLMPDGG